jgi:Holliday junction resolvase RusA-like endonuclease
MDEEIRITVPGLPPSVNHYYKMSRWGGRYMTAEGVAFKKLVAEAVRTIEIKACANCRYRLRIDFCGSWTTKKGTTRRVDLDNYGKSSIDSLFEAIGVDDCMVFELRMNKVESEVEQTVYVLSRI